MSGHNSHEISQAWANAQGQLPRGWRITELWEGARRFDPSPVASQARARRAEHPRADHAGDPWTAAAIGPSGYRVQKSGHDALDALERLTWEVDRAARRAPRA